MEEKMKGLDKLITEVNKYCNDNNIEYVFTAVADGGKYVKLSRNTITNAVLKNADKILQALIQSK